MSQSVVKLITLGVLLLAMAAYYLLRARQKATYAGYTMGTVNEIAYEPHSYYIRFSYTVDGRRYEGRTSISAFHVKRVAPGTTISVQYSLANPGKYYVRDPYVP